MRRIVTSALILVVSLGLLLSALSCTKTVHVTPTTEVIFQADLSQIGNQSASEAMKDAIDIITKRLDAYGVSGPVIEKVGSDRISVQLSGVSDVHTAINLIGSTAQLDFREEVYDSSGNPVLDGNGNPIWQPAVGIVNGQEVQLTGRYLERNAAVVFDQNTNQPMVSFELNGEGADLFAQITGRLIGKPLGIFLDNNYVSSPVVQAKIEGGKGVIENIKLDDARNLAILLNAEAVPVPLGHWEGSTFLSGPAEQSTYSLTIPDPNKGSGSRVPIVFKEPVAWEALRNAFIDLGYPKVGIQYGSKDAFLVQGLTLTTDALNSLINALQARSHTTVRIAEFSAGGNETSGISTLGFFFGKTVSQPDLSNEFDTLGYTGLTIEETTLDFYVVRTPPISMAKQGQIRQALEQEFGPVYCFPFDTYVRVR